MSQMRPLTFEHPTRTQPAITVTTDGVYPMSIEVRSRRAQSAPSRLKVQFGHRVQPAEGEAGKPVFAPMAEFRLELN